METTLIERNHHICHLNPVRDFVKNFKSMFLNEHPIFFKSEIFNYAINDHHDIGAKLKEFVDSVNWYCEPDDEPEALLYRKLSIAKEQKKEELKNGSSGGKAEEDEDYLKIIEDRESS